jgi:hypothetical protein
MSGEKTITAARGGDDGMDEDELEYQRFKKQLLEALKTEGVRKMIREIARGE